MTHKVYVISDTHFGHKNIIKFDDTRPWRQFDTIEEHDKELLARWNAIVNPSDTVWHLGDVYFGKDSHWIMGALNGTKKLVMGNHDHYPMEIYQKYFSKIYGVFQYDKCILSHVPVHAYQLEHRFKKNIHGHMHSQKLDDNRYVCVSAEHTGLAPVLMDDVISGKFKGI